MKFGDYLRQKREDSGWTQPEAAAKAKIEQSYLSKLETGKSYPSEDIFDRLVSIYAINTADMASTIFSAELDKLREIKEVRAVVLSRQQNQSRFMRGWLVAGLVMLMLAGAILGLAYSIPNEPAYEYHYRSEGIILEGEPPLIFKFLEAGVPDENNDPLTDRLNYDFQTLSDDRGQAFIVPVEGGYRRYERLRIKPAAGPSKVSWHFSIGFMFVFGGVASFYIARRWQ